MNEKDPLPEEFKSAESLHRFEVTLMLGQTAVYLFATGSLLNAVNYSSKSSSDFYQIGISLFGIFLSLVFFVITHRSGLNQGGAVKRAKELAEILGYKLYSSEYRAPNNKFLAGKIVTKGVCLIGGLFWLVILAKEIWPAASGPG